MSADDNVYFAFFQLGEDLFLFFRRAGAAQVIHFYGKIGQSSAERFVMLGGQHGGRYQNGRLFAIGGRFESRTYGYFRLAEAHVAAYQPVHRMVTFHIQLDFLRGF
ncbi:hypothetical protein SDC9_74940 [bioreactor metagenome]|uniref:Uncharacterized protein n=1 Tax=bioreactor metagenome TaxID=1076179 RepID=A0A644YKB1_9ZZZZ